MTHTPGPWKFNRFERAGIYGYRVIAQTELGETVVCEMYPMPYLVAISEHNARLIAKAPEMYAALAALFEHCAMVHKHWGDGSNAREADTAIATARALLAEIDVEVSQ